MQKPNVFVFGVNVPRNKLEEDQLVSLLGILHVIHMHPIGTTEFFSRV